MRAQPPQVRSTLVEWMGVDDANTAGFVHGGTVMKLCDEAAGVAAIRHSRCRVVTAAMDRMTFLLPIHVGELLTLKACVNAVWRTSMEVGVRVEAENPRTGEVPPHQHRATSRWSRSTTTGARSPCRRSRPRVPTRSAAHREAQVRRANSLAEREQIRAERAAKGEPD